MNTQVICEFLLLMVFVNASAFAAGATVPVSESFAAMGESHTRSQAVAPDVPTGAADAGVALSLEQCLGIALANNPELEAAAWDVETLLAERDMVHGERLPEIGLVGGFSHFREDRLISPRRPGPIDVLGFTDDLLSGHVVLEMPLFSGGRLVRQVHAAEFRAEAARQRWNRTKRELVFNVTSVFYSMLGQEEVIRSLEFSKEALQEHHQQTLELLEARKAACVDLLRTDVRLADVQQRLLHEQNVLEIKRFVLSSLLGSKVAETGPRISGMLTLVAIPDGVDQGLEVACSRRCDYLALAAQLHAQEMRVQMARGKRFPDVSLHASYGNQWATDRSDSNEVGQVGVALHVPIFAGGRISAAIRREQHRLRALQAALNRLHLQIRLEVQTAVSDIRSADARVGVTQKAVDQAKESLRIEREKYEIGKGAIVDVLDAQSALLNAQMTYYRSLAEYNTALAQFRLATGPDA